MAEVVPDLKVFEQLQVVPPQKEQSEVGWLSDSNPPEKELAQPTPISPQSGLSVLTHEHANHKKKLTSQIAPNGTPWINERLGNCWRNMQMSLLKMTSIWSKPQL